MHINMLMKGRRKMYTYKLVEKLKRGPRILYQIGRSGYHVLNFFCSNTKRWDRETSFSQCGEDLIVSYILKNMMNVNKISYLDIGCNHPYRLNNTAILREKFEVRKGVLVEPNPDVVNLIRRKRKKDICLNIGVGSRGGVLPYYMMNENTLNTFDKNEVDRIVQKGFHIEQCMSIKICEINGILQKYFSDGRLDFLSIDIEGNDFEVLRAIRYDKIRPAVICTETAEYMGGKNSKFFELVDFYKKINYVLIADTRINSIFIDKHQVKNKDFLRRCLF